jgi:hypothetical protein
MKVKRIQFIAVALSSVGMLISPAAHGAITPAVKGQGVQAPRDITLHEGGVLMGQMLDPQGAAIAGAPVSVQTAGKEVARAVTDQSGKFKIAGLQGGVHQVATVGQQDDYRLWAPQTAPPSAQQGLMLVSSNDLVRGQGCGSAVGCGSSCGCGTGVFGGGGGGRIGNWVANHPLLTAGVIGAAIAIPLAVSDDDPPASP